MYEQLKNYNFMYDKKERKKLTAEAIKAIRIQNNLQQKEVAELIGISQQTYNAYEVGKNEVPIEILVRLSFLYELPIEILVQQNNFDKYKNTAKNIVNEYEKQIAELKEKIKTADPVTQLRLTSLLDGIEKLNETVKKSLE